MSNQISDAFVKQYSANVFHLSQQQGSRLQDKVRKESQKSKAQFFDRIGAVAAQKKVSRHSDTPQLDTPHSRRMVSLVDYEWADLIDDADKIKMLNDPTSDYALAAMWALGRSKDDEIIEKAHGTAYSGEEGTTAVTFPTSQSIAAVASSALSNLNVGALRLAKKYFGDNDVDESVPLHAAVTSSQIYAMLGEDKITSADYNTIRALVAGDVDSFMGFKFVRTQRLLVDTAAIKYNTATGVYDAGGTSGLASRDCIFWAQDGLLLSTAQEVKGRISERDDKSYSTQVYACMGIGSTRMEEVKVLKVSCKE